MKGTTSVRIHPPISDRSIFRFRSSASASQLCLVIIGGVMVISYFVFLTSLQKTNLPSSINPLPNARSEFDTIDATERIHESDLAFVSFPFHNACNGNGEKLSCQTTILFHEEIPLRNISDSTQRENVCLQVDAKSTPFIQLPVCVQNADGAGVLVYIAPNINDIVVAKSIHDESVTNFIAEYIPGTARVIELKKVDFPTNYKRIDDTKNLVWERMRDDNYGNMVWRYASSMILNPVTVQLDRNDLYGDLELQDGPVDALVIATANTLHMTEEPQLKEFIDTMTTRITTRNVSTIILGLGIQSEFNDDHLRAEEGTMEKSLLTTIEKLPHSFQTDFLAEASKRQLVPSIGVRGDMTNKICENSGIKNCVSMGCPSLSISRNINLGSTLAKNWDDVMERLRNRDHTLKIAVTAPASAGKIIDLCRLAMSHIFDEFKDQATLIEQAPLDWPRLEEFIAQNWTLDKPTSNLTSASIKHIEYYNVESWLVGARDFDLCISFRVHGAMMFLNPGIPTILIPTDFRIMELISSMKVPYVTPSQLKLVLDSNFNNSQTINPDVRFKLLESLMSESKNTNFTEFELNRRDKLSGWKAILNSVGLEMDPALQRVMDSPVEM